jgi:uncharacterized protein YaaQ
MQLLWAIVQAEDADLLVERLVAQGFRLTRINSVGSFLARGNATILMGVADEQIEQALAVLRATCRTRRAFVNALPQVEAASISLAAPMPIEVLVGGAVVFGFPVQRFLRLRGGAAPPSADQQYPLAAAAGDASQLTEGGTAVNMVLAILQNEDADLVAGGLLAAGYRLTRLNTAGGFLRRGNVTLLVGVEAQKVDDVLGIIQANCRLREEARPLQAGMPMYSATVFVLDAARFVHV